MGRKKFFIDRYSEEWERLANREARAFCPRIYPCGECGGPVLKGYCCNHCGSINPEERKKSP